MSTLLWGGYADKFYKARFQSPVRHRVWDLGFRAWGPELGVQDVEIRAKRFRGFEIRA